MARTYLYIEGDKIGDTEIKGHYIKIKDNDDSAFTTEGFVVDSIKDNYINISHVAKEVFKLQLIGKCRVIGPFSNEKMALGIINKINGYCSSGGKKKERKRKNNK